MFKQSGQMYAARSNTLDIHYSNRGYSFGLRINDSGFGASAYHTKKEGIGKTLKRLLHASLHSMIQEVVRRKSLIPSTPIYTSMPKYRRPIPTPIHHRATSIQSLNNKEKIFLDRIKRRRGNR